MSEFKFEITEHMADIGEGSKGWVTELNLVSWNDREPKYDIRSWDPNHEKMGKGISLTKEELANLKNALNQVEL